MDNAILTPVHPVPTRYTVGVSYDLFSGLMAQEEKVHHEITVSEVKGGVQIESTLWSKKNDVLAENVTQVVGPYPINVKLFSDNVSRMKNQERKVELIRRLGAQVRQAQDCLAEEDILDAKGAIYGLILTTTAFG